VAHPTSTSEGFPTNATTTPAAVSTLTRIEELRSPGPCQAPFGAALGQRAPHSGLQAQFARFSGPAQPVTRSLGWIFRIGHLIPWLAGVNVVSKSGFKRSTTAFRDTERMILPDPSACQ